ncbi:MAG: hypothetical protein IJ573_11255 [Clostridia bacterium]|nr:hypothetical protein [Clostridia bacterium]
MSYTPSRDERETIILIYPTQAYADIGTNDPEQIRKLDRLCTEYPDDYRCTEVNRFGEQAYQVSKRLVAFKKPQTNAQKAARRKAAQKMLSARGIKMHSTAI